MTPGAHAIAGGLAGPGGPALPALPTVLVTRPQPQADEWVAKLARQGLDAVALPLLVIAPASDESAVLRAWQSLPDLSLVMFVSPNAVQRFFAMRPRLPATPPQWPPGLIAGGTGPGSHQALRDAGVPETLIRTPGAHDPAYAGPFDSEALWQQLAGLAWAGRQALIVRGEGGRDWLADALRQQGAQVHFVEAYRRTSAVPQGPALAALQAAMLAPDRHLWLLSSSEAVGYLDGWASALGALEPAAAGGPEGIGGRVPRRPWAAHQALATHPRIAQAALALGFGKVGLAAPSPAGVARALREAAGGLPGDPPAAAPSIQSRIP